jgi:hypothetical protein
MLAQSWAAIPSFQGGIDRAAIPVHSLPLDSISMIINNNERKSKRASPPHMLGLHSTSWYKLQLHV